MFGVQKLQEAFKRRVELVVFVDHVNFYNVSQFGKRCRGGAGNPIFLDYLDVVCDLLEQLSLEFRIHLKIHASDFVVHVDTLEVCVVERL